MRSTWPRDSVRLQPARAGMTSSLSMMRSIFISPATGSQFGREHGPSILGADLQTDVAPSREDLLAHGAAGAQILDQRAAHLRGQRGTVLLRRRVLVQIDEAVLEGHRQVAGGRPIEADLAAHHARQPAVERVLQRFGGGGAAAWSAEPEPARLDVAVAVAPVPRGGEDEDGNDGFQGDAPSLRINTRSRTGWPSRSPRFSNFVSVRGTNPASLLAKAGLAEKTAAMWSA